MARKQPLILPNGMRALRQQRGQSLAVVAKGANTTLAQIGKLETGERKLSYDWLVRVGRHFKVPPADLLLPSDGGLTIEERRVIDTIRELPTASRDMLMSMVESQQPHRQPRTAPATEAPDHSEDRMTS